MLFLIKFTEAHAAFFYPALAISNSVDDLSLNGLTPHVKWYALTYCVANVLLIGLWNNSLFFTWPPCDPYHPYSWFEVMPPIEWETLGYFAFGWWCCDLILLLILSIPNDLCTAFSTSVSPRSRGRIFIGSPGETQFTLSVSRVSFSGWLTW